jgi:hypothetical protein
VAFHSGYRHGLDLLGGDFARSIGVWLVGQPIQTTATKRCRHLRTICGHTPSAVTSYLDLPAVQSNSLRHRYASTCNDFARCVQRCNVCRSSSVNAYRPQDVPWVPPTEQPQSSNISAGH